ncbi:MAG: hypothetical protein AABX83_04300 [Nanoarchaeota archaeon]
MEKNRGQISTEYLVIVSFITILIIGILSISLLYSSQINDRIRINHLQNFANKIISSSERIYYSGEPSKSTVSAFLPAGVTNFEIIENQLVFSIVTSSGLTTIAFTSNVPIEGVLSISEGVKVITVTAQSDKVVLTEG